MKDFDFDELDKAVSSVLTKQKKTSSKSAQTNNDKKSSESDPATTSSQQPDTSSAANEINTKQATTPTSSPISIAPRRSIAFAAQEPEQQDSSQNSASTPSPAVPPSARTRFMDVVHPTAGPAPANLSVRRNVVVEPLNAPPISDMLPPKPKTENNLHIQNQDEPKTSQQETVTSETIIQPDSLETSQSPAVTSPAELHVTDQQPAAVGTTETTNDLSPSVEVDPVIEEKNPPTSFAMAPASESPFLPNAQVEKRPLNVLDADKNAQSVETQPEDDQDKTAIFTAPQPTEEDIPRLEVNDDTGPDMFSPYAQPLPKEVVEESKVAHTAPELKTMVSTTSQSAKTEPISPSIAPQYHIKQSAPTTETHPVFDTSNYHQPLLPAGHKSNIKAIILWVLIGLASLGLGAVGAILLFMNGH